MAKSLSTFEHQASRPDENTIPSHLLPQKKMVDPLRQGFQQSGWDQAARQAEQSVAESSGQQQRAGGDPVQAALSWETSPMLHGLLEQYVPDVVQAPILSSYIYQPDTDLEWVKHNTVS